MDSIILVKALNEKVCGLMCDRVLFDSLSELLNRNWDVECNMYTERR